jgi:hypothetical protein
VWFHATLRTRLSAEPSRSAGATFSLSTAAMGILFYKISLTFALIYPKGLEFAPFETLDFCSVSYRGFWHFQLSSIIPLLA